MQAKMSTGLVRQKKALRSYSMQL